MTRQLRRLPKVRGALLAAGVSVFLVATAMAEQTRLIPVERHLMQRPILQNGSSPIQSEIVPSADHRVNTHARAEFFCQTEPGEDPPQDDSGGGIDNGGEEERSAGAVIVHV
jgi:hypothetical protein